MTVPQQDSTRLRPWLDGHRPTGGKVHREAGRSSVKHLQELYTVAVGLALTVGVERVMPAEGHGEVQLRVSLLFAAFVSTLVPFYHGAQRHLDVMYIFDKPKKRDQGLFFGDFMFLFVEACLLIAMGAAVERPVLFLVVWLVLLSLDVLWLFVVIFSSGMLDPCFTSDRPGLEGKAGADEDEPQRSLQYFGWAVANVPMILVGALALIRLSSTGKPSVGQAAVVLLLCAVRTAFDYAWSWHFYFPVKTAEERG